MLKLILIILAVVFFALDFFSVTLTVGSTTVKWTPGGFALLATALFLVGG